MCVSDIWTALGGRLSEIVHQMHQDYKEPRCSWREIKAGKQMQSGGSYNSRSNLKRVETLLSLDVFGSLPANTLSCINPESLLTCCWYDSKQTSLNFTRNDCIFIVQREKKEGLFPTASPVQIRVISQQIRFLLQTSRRAINCLVKPQVWMFPLSFSSSFRKGIHSHEKRHKRCLGAAFPATAAITDSRTDTD